MLRIAIGKNGMLSSISRNGKLLPVTHAEIILEVNQPTEVRMTLAEANGYGTSFSFERLNPQEELQIDGVE